MSLGVSPPHRRAPLPPGQRSIDTFPRFGVPRPLPHIPRIPALHIGGEIRAPLVLPLAALARLPRREMTADFHCVAGWSFPALRWEGVPFRVFYAEVIQPRVRPGARITHVLFGGLDGYVSVLRLDDALRADVLLAERLDDRPLDGDHGAPLRLLSPSQYGYVSTKHLCRIEVHTSAPADTFGRGVPNGLLFLRHPRARVWHEERHRFLPSWSVRGLYRALIGAFIRLNARSGRPPRPTGNPVTRGGRKRR